MARRNGAVSWHGTFRECGGRSAHCAGTEQATQRGIAAQAGACTGCCPSLAPSCPTLQAADTPAQLLLLAPQAQQLLLHSLRRWGRLGAWRARLRCRRRRGSGRRRGGCAAVGRGVACVGRGAAAGGRCHAVLARGTAGGGAARAAGAAAGAAAVAAGAPAVAPAARPGRVWEPGGGGSRQARREGVLFGVLRYRNMARWVAVCPALTVHQILPLARPASRAPLAAHGFTRNRLGWKTNWAGKPHEAPPQSPGGGARVAAALGGRLLILVPVIVAPGRGNERAPGGAM